MEQVEKMRGDGILVPLHFNAAAIAGVLMPIEKHGGQGGEERVGDGARSGVVVVRRFGQHTAENGNAGAQHVHRVGGGRQNFEGQLYGSGQTAQRAGRLAL